MTISRSTSKLEDDQKEEEEEEGGFPFVEM
jgi:hypothetical protein